MTNDVKKTNRNDPTFKKQHPTPIFSCLTKDNSRKVP